TARTHRAFDSVDDLLRRVPALRRDELVTLAQVGALNHLQSDFKVARMHRRDALWQVERAARAAGPLLAELPEEDFASPLEQMTAEERLVADYHGTGLTVGPHPMQYRRAQMDAMKVKRAADLPQVPDGRRTKIAGCVIARQRPGTASGFIFLSLEDETGISNAIITPQLYEQNRMTVLHGSYLMIEGVLKNLENVICGTSQRVEALDVTG